MQVPQVQEVNEMMSQLVFHCHSPPCHCMLMSRPLTQSQHGYICKQCKDGYGKAGLPTFCSQMYYVEETLSDWAMSDWISFEVSLVRRRHQCISPQPFFICDGIFICIWIFICPQPFCICDGICICPQLFYVCVGILICIWSSFLTESAVFIILIFWGKFF